MDLVKHACNKFQELWHWLLTKVINFGCDKITLLQALQTSVSTNILILVQRYNTIVEAWSKLETTYANRSNTCMLGLLDTLMKFNMENLLLNTCMKNFVKKNIRRMIKIIENDSFSLICFSIMVIYIGTSNHR